MEAEQPNEVLNNKQQIIQEFLEQYNNENTTDYTLQDIENIFEGFFGKINVEDRSIIVKEFENFLKNKNFLVEIDGENLQNEISEIKNQIENILYKEKETIIQVGKTLFSSHLSDEEFELVLKSLSKEEVKEVFQTIGLTENMGEIGKYFLDAENNNKNKVAYEMKRGKTKFTHDVVDGMDIEALRKKLFEVSSVVVPLSKENDTDENKDEYFISSTLKIDLTQRNEELIKQISSLHNPDLKDFLNYLYYNIPQEIKDQYEEKKGNATSIKHLLLSDLLFGEDSNEGQKRAVRFVTNSNKTLSLDKARKMKFDDIRKCIQGNTEGLEIKSSYRSKVSSLRQTKKKLQSEGKTIARTSNKLDAQQGILDTQQGILDTQQGILDAQKRILGRDRLTLKGNNEDVFTAEQIQSNFYTVLNKFEKTLINLDISFTIDKKKILNESTLDEFSNYLTEQNFFKDNKKFPKSLIDKWIGEIKK